MVRAGLMLLTSAMLTFNNVQTDDLSNNVINTKVEVGLGVLQGSIVPPFNVDNKSLSEIGLGVICESVGATGVVTTIPLGDAFGAGKSVTDKNNLLYTLVTLSEEDVPLGALYEDEEELRFNDLYDDRTAVEFITRSKDAVSAQIEYCRPSDWEMLRYDLTDDELEKAKELLKNFHIDRTINSGTADFTYTLHLYDKLGKYVYVVALNKDKETLFVEPGELKCEGLADLIAKLSLKTK